MLFINRQLIELHNRYPTESIFNEKRRSTQVGGGVLYSNQNSPLYLLNIEFHPGLDTLLVNISLNSIDKSYKDNDLYSANQYSNMRKKYDLEYTIKLHEQSSIIYEVTLTSKIYIKSYILYDIP